MTIFSLTLVATGNTGIYNTGRIELFIYPNGHENYPLSQKVNTLLA